MIPNSPIGTSPLILPRIGAGSADGASAAGSSAPARSTSASAASAARAVVNTGAGNAKLDHCIPLHALGPGKHAVGALDAHAVVTPANDTLGMIASYLPRRDQQVMRSINTTMHKIVDPTIHTLKLTGDQACAVLSQPNALRNLRELQLIHCTDQELIKVAAILATMPKTDFELVVQGDPYNQFNQIITPDGIAPLADLRLTGLTLKDIYVSADMSRVLEHSKSLLSINLARAYNYVGDVFAISQLTKLHSLIVGWGVTLTPATHEALGSHQTMETLSVHAATESDIRTLAESACIRTLSIGSILGNGSAAALRALADNKVLTSLTLDMVDANALAVLSQNTTIQTLRLTLSALPKSLLKSLATMSALNDLYIGAHDTYPVSIEGDDIQAICAKPLKSLSIYDMALDSAARAHLATAQTASLRLQFCTAFGSEDFAVLSQNRSISSLFMGSMVTPRNNYQDVLSLVTNGLPQLESLTIYVLSETPYDAQAAIEAAWTASGRPLGKLVAQRQYISADGSVGYYVG